jgi:hypothetical protein
VLSNDRGRKWLKASESVGLEGEWSRGELRNKTQLVENIERGGVLVRAGQVIDLPHVENYVQSQFDIFVHFCALWRFCRPY